MTFGAKTGGAKTGGAKAVDAETDGQPAAFGGIGPAPVRWADWSALTDLCLAKRR
ncbi:hypothetical protein Mkiyose1088_38120 [Mycobacterium kiyosense]|uniref:Uncharacterized protein n=1 Tax=Mycobacterium kiyosense TaxID=2871094 RepID=A0AA37Q6S7_9MYCO|nr:hypothetical protein MKCMC460_55880 [Mycobacterium sp. 20KCMC460]GLB83939.1 hypothetical protein SRL2020028_31950 [Mycobacterium kiyosense]GLB90485.1 hypothetical protein SRL2020130_33020 [Mycobacterium kiyosense]GLB96299.1 hypothetical protein SRL2020226_30750 [Mycobacterium kiyosense]GLC02973.1 hypothetical protein SRL2020400_35640 [Mycobacterium kiyosense]